MNTALTIAGELLLFALGYGARIVRPLQQLDTWAWEQMHRRSRDLRTGPARRRPGWFMAQVVFAVEVLGLFVVHPWRIARQWRHRNDPPPPRSPAVTVMTYVGPPPMDHEGQTL